MELILHPLLLPILVPLLTGLVCLLLPARGERVRAMLALAGAALALALAWRLLARGGDALVIAGTPWLRVDPLSAFVALAIAAFAVLVALYCVAYTVGHARHREYFAYLSWTLAAALGAVLANDLVLLLVCWGLLGLALYLMIGIAGADAAEAARASFMIVGGGDAVLLLGVVLLWSVNGTTRMDAGPVALETGAAQLAFLAFAVAAFAKAGAVPFHAWVPECGARAPAPVAAFLPASLDKLLGVYLLARSALDLFQPNDGMRLLLMTVGAATVLVGVMLALVQSDLKRLLSYQAVSQMGYMVLGIGTGTAIGVAAGLFHMLNDAICKCCLFLCAGNVERATGTTDLNRLGGLSKSMPLTFVAATIAALAISGVPPLNGFASKWMVFQAIIASGREGGGWWLLWLAVAMVGSALTLASFVKALHGTFLCKPAPSVAAQPVREGAVWLWLPVVALAALCVLFGVAADAVPLRWLVFPAAPAAIIGVWWAGLATVLILAAIAAGAVVYALAMAGGRLRRCETYIGGEHLDEAYIHGEASGPARHLEVTGVDFYDTIEQLPGVRRLYGLAKRRALDVYVVAALAMSYFVGLLRRAHTGALPLYLSWFLAGLLAVLYATTQAGP